jgi:putative ABC transport system ATP-binding protein
MNESMMSSEADPACVSLEGVQFRYGTNSFRLDIDSLNIAPSERVVLLGPSGSGKSTLLHLIAGILTPDAGTILLEGVDLLRQGDAGRRRIRIHRVGLVFQEFELLDHLSVRENILLPYFVERSLQHDESVERRLESLAEAAGLLPLLSRKPRSLSQGERQRVAICRALITEPALVLADEPTGNLDPDTTNNVLEMLLSEVSRRDKALLMVTHDHSLVGSFDRAINLAELGGSDPA